MSKRSEANILNDCLIAMSAAGGMAWRQNTGAYKDKTGRLIRYGLCVGSSDIIGIAPGGVFVAVECKTASGRVSDNQEKFINNVRRQGGRAGVARCADDAVSIMMGLTEQD